MLISLRKSAPVSFELIAVNLDQKQPGFPEHVLPDYRATQDVPFYVIERDTYSTVKRVVPPLRGGGVLYSFFMYHWNVLDSSV